MINKTENPWVLSEVGVTTILEGYGLSLTAIRKLGIHSRVVYATFEKYPQVHLDWKSKESLRRSKKMLGNKNGTHPPTKLAPKDGFLEDVANGMRKYDLMAKYGLSEFSFERNIDWYQLEEPFNGTKKIPAKILEDHELIEKIEQFVPGVKTHILHPSDYDSEEVLHSIRKAQIALVQAAAYLAKLGTRYRNRYQAKGVSFSTNRGEMIVEQILNDLGVSFTREYSLTGDKVYSYDFHIPSKNLLLEIHGTIHNWEVEKTKDGVKKKLAEEYGFIYKFVPYKDEKNFEKFNKELTDALS